jgi:predicted nucleotidyltransferase
MVTLREAQVKSMIRETLMLFRGELAQAHVYFFGSRVSGKARERSDFDVAIDGVVPVEPRLFARIRTALDELPTLYRIDLVDLTYVPAPVRAEMLGCVEAIL